LVPEAIAFAPVAHPNPMMAWRNAEPALVTAQTARLEDAAALMQAIAGDR
jgi:hypothetical protein